MDIRFGGAGARRRLLLIVVTLAVCAAAACGEPAPRRDASPAASSLPCPDATEVVLGSPYTYATRGPAYFTTRGGTVYLSARRFEQGGVLDPPRPRTEFAVGPASTPPVVDRQRATVAGARLEVQAGPSEWAQAELPAGRWWLLSSSGGDVRVASCDRGGVSDPLAVG